MDDAKSSVQKYEIKTIFDAVKMIFHFISTVILYSVFVIFIGIIAIFIVYFADQIRNINARQEPLFNAYVIVSPSMVPTIKVQDAILVKRKTVDELKVGDIITFTSNDARYSGLTVTHRIVNIQKSETGKILITTKGDNNNTEDGAFVTEDNLIGKVILKIPKVGYLQSFLLNIYGWIILIVIPCVGVIVYDIIKIIRNVSNKEPKNKNKEITVTKENIEVLELIDEDNHKKDIIDDDNIELLEEVENDEE